DLPSIDWTRPNQPADSASDSRESNPQTKIPHPLDDLFLRHLDDFTVQASTVLYQTLAGHIRQLDIDKLHWNTMKPNATPPMVKSVSLTLKFTHCK
ncbi:hypothetical protein K6U27_10795, partial [Vibrio fluvialis]|uniref:hypothetical protein n=1 Tax=Vibrio fluvialis TaxID=676 RepID=UPI001EEBB5F0